MNNTKSVLTAALISGTLLLVACGGGESPAPQPEPQPTGSPNIVQGQITPLPAGLGSVAVPLLKDSAVDALKNARAAVDTNGNFTLTLPDAAAMDQSEDLMTPGEALGGGSCAEGAVNAPEGLRLFAVYAVDGDNGKQYIDKVDNGHGGAAVTRLRVYSTADGRVLLNGTCLLTTVSGDLNLKRGWNVVEGTFSGSNSSFRVVDAPVGTVPFVERGINAGSLSWQSLPANIFEPWRSLPRYQNR